MPAMLINLAGMVALTLFLLANGSSIDAVVFIAGVWFWVFVIYIVVNFFESQPIFTNILLIFSYKQAIWRQGMGIAVIAVSDKEDLT